MSLEKKKNTATTMQSQNWINGRIDLEGKKPFMFEQHNRMLQNEKSFQNYTEDNEYPHAQSL